MNLKKSGKTLWIVAAVAMLAMVLQGCGGDDGVSPSTHMDVEDERDMYKAEAERLQGEAERLQGELGTATTDLAAANTRIGSAPDADGMGGSGLLGDLAAEMAKVAMYMEMVNGDGTPDNPGLTAQLTAAMQRIGEAPGPDGMGGSGLLGDLAAEMAKVAMYMEMINGDGTPDNPGLQAQLDAANERIASLLKGEDPDQITPISGNARTAATDARTAATEAGEYADDAEMSDDNRATIQTGDADSVAHAKYARMQADTADTQAGNAETAATMAEAATTTADANKYMNMAQTAKTAAETVRDMAKTQSEMAEADAMMELKIDGTMKSVGDTIIDATAASSVVTTDGQTVNTGLQGDAMQPTQMVDATTGTAVAAATPNADPPGAYMPPTAGAAARTLTIGKTVDSADDMARLMIVTHYAGSDTVKVYATDGGTDRSGTKSGYISLDDGDATTGVALDPNAPTTLTDVNNVRLRFEGVFYLAGATSNTIAPTSDSVGMDTEGQQVYSHPTVGSDGDLGTDDDGTEYVVLLQETAATVGGETTTTYTYSTVTIHDSALNHDGVATTPDISPEVTAKIPTAMDYEHIHFGVWAALGDAEKDGTQEIDALGIGFLQSIGDGMTGADMPNNGDASYTGNWVATVQAEAPDGEGDITLEHGAATIAADFDEGDITATLTGLATLTGDIAGNSFSGTGAEATGGGLDTDADFEGSFSGGFYGAKAAEAGGVFDFASDDGDNEGGAFVGAFGGARD